MSELDIIDNAIHFKRAFGSFVILDDIDPVNHIQVYKFAKIVSNYLAMDEQLKNENMIT
jgi:hypothetical protein